MFPLRSMLPWWQGHALCTVAPALCYSWWGMCRQHCYSRPPPPPTLPVQGVRRDENGWSCGTVFPCVWMCVNVEGHVPAWAHKIANAHNQKKEENANIWSIDSCFNLRASIPAAEEHFLCRMRFSFPLHTNAFQLSVTFRLCFSSCMAFWRLLQRKSKETQAFAFI